MITKPKDECRPHAPPCNKAAGRKDGAKRSLCTLLSAFPSLTISQIRTGLPHSVSFLDNVSNGLESVGMRIC
jgi:hypothetical protein